MFAFLMGVLDDLAQYPSSFLQDPDQPENDVRLHFAVFLPVFRV